MKLEVGKIYLDRCGDRWEIIHHRQGDAWPFTGRTLNGNYVEIFKEDGRILFKSESQLDLISEAPEVVTIHIHRHRETGQIVPTACGSAVYSEDFEHIKTIEVEL